MYDEDSDDAYFEHYNDEDNDNERDTFYALTDGMYGDYDEWKENGGDMDNLMDFANKMSPLGNASAEECANYCVMMFSDFTRKVTMQNLFHDGGFSSMGMSLRAMNQYSKDLTPYEDKQGNHQHWAEKKKDERREVARCDEGQMAKDTGGDDVAC